MGRQVINVLEVTFTYLSRFLEMNTIYTPPASGYIPVMRNLRPNFDLAISVRTDPAGYIELCNSLRSSCLLFKLWQFRISVSRIRQRLV